MTIMITETTGSTEGLSGYVPTIEEFREFINNLDMSYLEEENNEERFAEFRNFFEVLEIEQEDVDQLFEDFIYTLIQSYGMYTDHFVQQMFDIFLDHNARVTQLSVNRIFSFNCQNIHDYRNINYTLSNRVLIVDILIDEIDDEQFLNIPSLRETVPIDGMLLENANLDNITDFNSLCLANLKFLVNNYLSNISTTD